MRRAAATVTPRPRESLGESRSGGPSRAVALDLPLQNNYDRNDADRLAKLLYPGEMPTVHVQSLCEIVIGSGFQRNGCRRCRRSSIQVLVAHREIRNWPA